MDNINDVVALIMDSGLLGSRITVQIDTDILPLWGMLIQSEGGNDYYLSNYENGGYLLQGSRPSPNALITTTPKGMISMTKDPEAKACGYYMPTLTKESLVRTLHLVRTALRQTPPPIVKYNNN